MNVETGDLYIDKETAEAMLREKNDEFDKELKKLREVPEHHAKEAFKELGGKDHVKVDLSKNTPLTRWANRACRAIHKENHRKIRRKAADASRKRNRRK